MSSESLPLLTHWIDNDRHAGISPRCAVRHDPATGRATALLALAGVGECASAAGAWPAWAATPMLTRARLMVRFEDLLERHRDEIARLITREHGKVLAEGEGYFVGPTRLDHVGAELRIYRDEIFGPVLCVVQVPSLAAATALVNAHESANGVALFTRDGGTTHEFARRAAIGVVGINVPIPVPAAFHRFGDRRQSLFGDTAIYGREGVHFYPQLKTVTARSPSAARGGIDLQFPTMKWSALRRGLKDGNRNIGGSGGRSRRPPLRRVKVFGGGVAVNASDGSLKA